MKANNHNVIKKKKDYLDIQGMKGSNDYKKVIAMLKKNLKIEKMETDVPIPNDIAKPNDLVAKTSRIEFRSLKKAIILTKPINLEKKNVLRKNQSVSSWKNQETNNSFSYESLNDYNNV